MDYKGIDFGVYVPASILPFWIQISPRAKLQQKSSPCRVAARAQDSHCKVWATKDTAHSSCSLFSHLQLLSSPAINEDPVIFSTLEAEAALTDNSLRGWKFYFVHLRLKAGFSLV